MREHREFIYNVKSTQKEAKKEDIDSIDSLTLRHVVLSCARLFHANIERIGKVFMLLLTRPEDVGEMVSD